MGSNCITLLDHDTYCQAEIFPFSTANCICKSVIFRLWQVEREEVGINAIKECVQWGWFTAGLAAVQWWRFFEHSHACIDQEKKKKTISSDVWEGVERMCCSSAVDYTSSALDASPQTVGLFEIQSRALNRNSCSFDGPPNADWRSNIPSIEFWLSDVISGGFSFLWLKYK